MLETLKTYWGYESFLPLQAEAVEAAAAGRDCLVVLPTGGGKSLCYQLPAVASGKLTVVVSPLISLMTDQVEALRQWGIPAARIDSSQTDEQRNAALGDLHEGVLRLLYLSPERLLAGGMPDRLRSAGLGFLAIDEAHCVSMWGHDFRPEYRRLGTLRELYPDVPIGAYTATATPEVRRDIIAQLSLRDPAELIGSFDRPNLVYSSVRRRSKFQQVCEFLDRHRGESGIIYCIRRADVDELAADLQAEGRSAMPYHAGLGAERRAEAQEAFLTERVETIVATVAFGMGIDKSNVRYVLHAAMPKSLEHYQQEAGRAGRDRLEADCRVLWSPGDYSLWKTILELNEPSNLDVSLRKLNEMYDYCTGVTCRHDAILRYFGQRLDGDQCGACDVCLGDLACISDGLVTAQKILSCVVRLEERFGADYTCQVLTGSTDRRILDNGHDALSTYGLLSDQPKRVVRGWCEQLVAQGYAAKVGEYNTLHVTPEGWEVLRGRGEPRLLAPAKKAPAKRSARVVSESWEGVDRGLFEALREARSRIAQREGIPAYMVFHDAALRDMARHQPTTKGELLDIHGVGQRKADRFGEDVLETLRQYGDA